MKRICCLAVAMLLIHTAKAEAAGLAFADESASALGVANAFVATASDPSAVVYNPAGIAWQDGAGIMLGGIASFRDSSVIVGGSVPTNDGTAPTLWHLYATWMPLDSDWGFGVGVSAPYAFENNWGDGIFSGQASFTSIIVYRASFDAVYALNSSMAISVGADWYYGSMDLNSVTTLFHGSDITAFGGHVAWMWKPGYGWSVGAMFRSGAKLDISGSASGAVNGGADVGMRLPEEVRLGVAHDILDNLRLELDASWTRWSALDDLSIVGSTIEANPMNFRDSFAVMAGITWTWRENAQVRLGYAYDRGASQDPGLHARITDADSHRISVGFGGDAFGAHFDIAYAYSFYVDHAVSASGVFNGTYRDRRQSLALTLATFF